MERGEENSYERTFTDRGRAGTIRIALVRRRRSLFLSQKIPLWANPDDVSARVSRLFDLAADPRAISRVLSRAERWRPFCAYATLLLWASLADATGGA